MRVEIEVTVTDGKYGSDSVTVRIPTGISRRDPKEKPAADALKNNTMLRALVEDTEQNLIDAIQEYAEKILDKQKPDDVSDAE
jgi:hypothetical protein